MDPPSSGSTGPLIPAIPHDILVQQKQGQAISTWLIGAFCILCWELIICASKEYRLVWKKPMNISSLLYLTNRYFGLFEFCIAVSLTTDAWSPSACQHFALFDPISGLISIILSQAILGGRVFAIYSRNKALACILGSILLAEAVIGGIAVSTSSPSLPIPNAPPGSQPPCGVLGGPFGWLVTYWTLPLLYDSIIFFLTAWKAFDLWRREAKMPIFNIIWFDGLLYFFANLSMNIINVLIFLLASPTLQHFNLAPTIMFQVILSCRMFLHLKGSNNRPDFRSDKPNSNNNLKFSSYMLNGTGSKDRSDSQATSGLITVDTKRATAAPVSAQAYELDVRVKPSHDGWDMA